MEITCYFCDAVVLQLPGKCRGCGARLKKLVREMTHAEFFESLKRNRRQALLKLMKHVKSTLPQSTLTLAS